MSLDSPIVRDGDSGWIGFASRMNPLTLAAGLAQLVVNMRLDRGMPQTRRGAKRLAEDVNPGDEPLTVPFDLAETVAVSLAASGTTVTGTTAGAHGFQNGDQVAIEGAEDEDYNGDFVVGNVTGTTFEYTALSAPVAVTDAGTVTMGPIVKSVYDGGIFAAGVYSSPLYDNGNEYLALAGPGALYLVREDSPANVLGYPSSPDEVVEPTDTVSVLQAFDRLYVLREADAGVTGWGRKVTTSSGITVSGTAATVHVTAHGYETGMRVRLEGSPVAAFSGHEFDVVTVPDADSFTVTVPSGTATDAVAGRVVRRVKAPLYWDGAAGSLVRAPGGVPAEGPTYRRMRSCGWAAYVNGRLIVPDGRDAVGVSDIGDPDLYDPYWNGFRANEGSNDRLVAVHPWVEGAFLVFFRRSIWLAEVNALAVAGGGDTLLSKLTLLTDEVGCAARKSIATAGQYVYFLSDAGIYRLDARLDLKLRGDTRPLSDPIADQFEDLNADEVAQAVGIWFNNRYYVAVPKGAEDSNTTVYAFSALNDAWETKDIYGFGVQDFLVSGYRNARRLFVSSRAGALMLLDELEAGDAAADADVDEVTPVDAVLRTRRYVLGGLWPKRFLRSVTEAELGDGAAMEVRTRLYNPDAEVAVSGLENVTGDVEDYSYRQPIRQRAVSAELEFRTSAGRPVIRATTVEAAGPAMDPADTKTES